MFEHNVLIIEGTRLLVKNQILFQNEAGNEQGDGQTVIGRDSHHLETLHQF